jgi:hypothetical protein
MKLKRKTKKTIRNIGHKSVSIFLVFAILFELTYPTQVFALTGGPSQPEVQSFEPVGTSDMVDLFSGDFNYNIPLMDVEGYPINIAYHSGISMDQEASWVGLGWNINPGVVNRNVRGLPDDFAGDEIVKELHMKENKTWGVAVDLGLEVYGFDTGDALHVGVGATYGFKFNNYTGPSINQGVSVNISVGQEGAGSLNANLGINSSSDDGLTISPSAGFKATLSKSENSETSLGVNVGTAFNSRGGLKQLSINTSVSQSFSGDKTYDKESSDANGEKVYTTKDYNSASSSFGGAGATFDFGTATFTPMITNSMKNFAMTGSFTLGGEIWGLDGKVGVTGSYSSQKLAQESVTNPAYGYLYSEKGQANDNALMDFNREKDGGFTENTACLPVTNYTFDVYSVSGQGAGGSYRPYRGDVGYVYDPAASTTNDDDALALEMGLGGYVHLGTNVVVTDVNGQSGKWKNNNKALSKLTFNAKGKGNDFENVYFKEANEKSVDDDPAFYAAAGYDAPVCPNVDFSDKYEPILNGFGPVKRKKRSKRTQNISFLKRSDYNDFAIKPVSDTYSGSSDHIAEMTSLGNDGSRYVYGIAAYNTKQRDVTFSVASTNPALFAPNLSGLNSNDGLINYTSEVDNSAGNQLGIDNYFSRTTTPAFAHSYLLTSVLSVDYVDADAVRGPSDGDLGNYTRFAYKKYDYNWRVPFDSASYTEGLKSDLQDDKANYIYGEKDLWYLDSVITKNYVAIFHTSNRIDGAGVSGEEGGLGSGRMKQLDSISLYSKQDLIANPTTALPIKRVHFEYTNSLCKGIPNVSSGVGTNGKLTLKKIYFSYQNSNKARMSPYIFDYHETVAAENPNYNLKGYDRWGNFKPNTASATGVKNTTDVTNFTSGDLPTSDYPYVDQDTSLVNEYCSVWTLKEIQIPSGGKIKIDYESDDYAYVQDKRAGQMFKIINYNTASDAGNTPINFTAANGKFYFKLQPGDSNITHYTAGISNLYFRFLVNIRNVAGFNHLEYVSGYSEIEDSGIESGYGWVKMKDVNLKKNGTLMANPVVKAAIQFGRLYLPKAVWTADASEVTNMSNQGSLGSAILDALINSSFIKNIKDAIQGPNAALFNDYGVAHDFIANKSWIRLVNPNKKKLGGGCRVKKIEMSDEWASMTDGSAYETSNYGQTYDYSLDDGTSSGVASYEPQLGGDENPWRKPLFNDVEKMLIPNDQFYQEEPMGESFFPTPSVGYSKVTVKNLSRNNVTRHATGKVVHEFYTAKDFPIIVKRTDVAYKRGKDDPFSIRSLFKINVRDNLTAAQGFSVELNDMHGKPKSQKVYQEGHPLPISSIEYNYKKDPYGNGSFKLNNNCTTITKNGGTATNTIGESFDMVADFREDQTSTNSVTLSINVDVIPIYGVPFPIPMVWPSFAKQKTRFRSATSTKVIQRFGILEETIAQDLSSVVATKNIAYDATTGDVLLTETTTNFNDKVYNLKYPAWWYYESMGPAYQNIDFEMDNTTFNSSGVATIGNKTAYFKAGDELAVYGSPNKKGWVDSVSATTIKVIDRFGAPITGTHKFKVIRSGNRNNLGTEMATITTLSNPLIALKSNTYENIIQATAVEFSNKRKSHCDCLLGVGSPLPYTTNGYVTGVKGNWRLLKSYTHLTGRKQSNYDNNTNIRKDGIYTSYSPFYSMTNNGWKMTPKDWTYISEVTEFNAHSLELEDKDALGRYSSATFGYNQSMALSVAANSQYKEQGFDGFEDYAFKPCADNHFKFDSISPNTEQSHTGKYSLKVSSGAPAKLTKQIANACVDSTGCRLTIFFNIVDGTTANVTLSHALNPCSFHWEIISGDPSISLNSNGLEVLGSSYTIELTVSDSKNCEKTTILKR